MKSLLIFIFLLIITSVNVGAQYIEWQENNLQEGIITTATLWIEQPRICTMEYTPVCAEVQVQCFKAPCLPVTQTFGNICSAWDNHILFQGACSSYLNESLYKKYESKREAIEDIITQYDASRITRISEMIDQKIKMIQMSRMTTQMQKEKITQYSFMKSVINDYLSAK